MVFINEFQSILTVSYTHLDVYKRQFSGGTEGIQVPEDVLFLSFIYSSAFSLAPVSYTHLISRMANNRTNKKLVLQNTLKFIDEHHVPMLSLIHILMPIW